MHFFFGFFYNKYSYFKDIKGIVLKYSLSSANNFQGHCYHLYDDCGTGQKNIVWKIFMIQTWK